MRPLRYHDVHHIGTLFLIDVRLQSKCAFAFPNRDVVSAAIAKGGAITTLSLNRGAILSIAHRLSYSSRRCLPKKCTGQTLQRL